MTQGKEAERPARKFAVYSPTGVHIGLWDDGRIAADVRAESPGNTVEELVLASEYEALAAERDALRQALRRIKKNAQRDDATAPTLLSGCALIAESALNREAP